MKPFVTFMSTAHLTSFRKSFLFRAVTSFLVIVFTGEILLTDVLKVQQARADMLPPVSAGLVAPSVPYSLPMLKAIRVDFNHPFDIDFVVDAADAATVDEAESSRLIKYFLAFLAIPTDDLWVNLSPYEGHRIIPHPLDQTDLGRDMLEEDYLLKQLASSMTYPEQEPGRTFWQKVYQKARAVYGTAEIPVNTYSKVWVIPERATVYETGNTAFIGEGRLTVMLDEDYQALAARRPGRLGPDQPEARRQINQLSADTTREVILPHLQKEVNEGKHFARLRQMYQALILAEWFKRRLKTHVLNQLYADRGRIQGVDTGHPEVKEEIYRQYLEALRKGVYNYLREDREAEGTEPVVRKYFAGGFSWGNSQRWLSSRPVSRITVPLTEFFRRMGRKLYHLRFSLKPRGVAKEKVLALTLAAALAMQSVGPSLGMISDAVAAGSLQPQTVAAQVIPAPLGDASDLAAMTLDAASPHSLEQVAPASSKTEAPAKVDRSVISRGARLSVTDQQHLQQVKDIVSLQDIQALDGKVNPVTGRTYTIDTAYFHRNWDKIFESTQYRWPQETVVIAAQTKLGLWPDGDLGPQTSAAVVQAIAPQVQTAATVQDVSPGVEHQIVAAEQQPTAPADLAEVLKSTVQRAEDSDISHPSVETSLAEEVPVETVSRSFVTTLSQHISQLFSVFLTSASIYLVLAQVRRHRKQAPFDQDPFLAAITSYLQGKGKVIKGTVRRSLMARTAVLSDLFVRRTGNQLELTLRSEQALLGHSALSSAKADLAQALQRVFENGDVQVSVAGEGVEPLALNTVRVNTTSVKLLFNLPSRKSGGLFNGDRVTIRYRKGEDVFDAFSVMVSRMTVQDFKRRWKETLARPRIFITDQDLDTAIQAARKKVQDLEEKMEGFRTLYEQLDREAVDLSHAGFGTILASAHGEKDVMSAQAAEGRRLQAASAMKRAQSMVAAGQIEKMRALMNPLVMELRSLEDAMSLEGIVKSVRVLREKERFQFSKFRGAPAVTMHELKQLALHMLRRARKEHLPEVYLEYFYRLAHYSNEAQRLMGHAGSLDSNKSEFLPVRDFLRMYAFGIPVDKLLRVVFLKEYVFNGLKRTILGEIPDFQTQRLALDGLERQILGAAYSPGAVYSLEGLNRDFYGFIAALERPYADSIVGPDLWRRQKELVKWARNLLVFAGGFFVAWKLGWMTQAWQPMALFLGNFALMNYNLPMFYKFQTERRYRRKSRAVEKKAQLAGVARSLVVTEPVPEPGMSVKGKLLSFLSRNALGRISVPKYRLRAQLFYDLQAVRENSHIELRLLTDSDLPDEEAPLRFLKDFLLAPDAPLAVEYLKEDGWLRVDLARAEFSWHPTGVRIRLPEAPGVDDIRLRYRFSDSRTPALDVRLKVQTDDFRQLVNAWEHLLEEEAALDISRLHGVMDLLQGFTDPRRLQMSDFKKNAGYYNKIRQYAMKTAVMIQASSRGELKPYGRYFVELAQYANEVRRLTSGIAGIDVLKSAYLPDRHFFLKKVFGVSLATILRRVEGVTFLHEWSAKESLQAISLVATSSRTLSRYAQFLRGGEGLRGGDERSIIKHMRDDFMAFDYAIRFPAHHSIVMGKDALGRTIGMWQRVFHLAVLAGSLMLFMPFLAQGFLAFWGQPLTAVHLGTLMLSGAELLGIFLANMYSMSLLWSSPFLSRMITDYEYMFFQGKFVQLLSGTGRAPQVERWEQDFRARRFAYNASVLFVGTFLPFLTPVVYAFQQGFYWAGGRYRLSTALNKTPLVDEVSREWLETDPGTLGQTADFMEGSGNSPTGGIDWRQALEPDWLGTSSPSPDIEIPRDILDDFQGVDFHILQIQPILNPSLFFLGRAPRQSLTPAG